MRTNERTFLGDPNKTGVDHLESIYAPRTGVKLD